MHGSSSSSSAAADPVRIQWPIFIKLINSVCFINAPRVYVAWHGLSILALSFARCNKYGSILILFLRRVHRPYIFRLQFIDFTKAQSHNNPRFIIVIVQLLSHCTINAIRQVPLFIVGPLTDSHDFKYYYIDLCRRIGTTCTALMLLFC